MKKAGLRHCPTECVNQATKIDIYRTKYCDHCPRTRQHRAFEQQTVERWAEWLGPEAGEFDFETMVETLYGVMRLESLADDKLTVRGAAMLNIYRGEKERLNAQ